MPEFYIIIGRKIFFPNFGGHVPMVSKIGDVHLSFLALQISNYSGQKLREERNGWETGCPPVD